MSKTYCFGGQKLSFWSGIAPISAFEKYYIELKLLIINDITIALQNRGFYHNFRPNGVGYQKIEALSDLDLTYLTFKNIWREMAETVEQAIIRLQTSKRSNCA